MKEHRCLFTSQLPVILAFGDKEVKIVADGKIEPNDEVYVFAYPNIKYVVTEVIETRKPNGNFSGDSYKGKTPTYNHLKVRIEKNEPIKA